MRVLIALCVVLTFSAFGFSCDPATAARLAVLESALYGTPNSGYAAGSGSYRSTSGYSYTYSAPASVPALAPTLAPSPCAGASAGYSAGYGYAPALAPAPAPSPYAGASAGYSAGYGYAPAFAPAPILAPAPLYTGRYYYNRGALFDPRIGFRSGAYYGTAVPFRGVVPGHAASRINVNVLTARRGSGGFRRHR